VLCLFPQDQEQTNMTTIISDEKLMTRPEISAHFGITQRYLEELAVTGGGPPYVKLGRAVRYKAGDVRAWIEARRFDESPNFATQTSGASAEKGETMENDLPLRILKSLKKGAATAGQLDALIEETEAARDAFTSKVVELIGFSGPSSRGYDPVHERGKQAFRDACAMEAGLTSSLKRLQAVRSDCQLA
jgi:predicted DNA-binding transcriptional regulator AlpA